MVAAFVDVCMDKRIKQRCLKLTNCSFKKAQSGSENPPPLLYVPAAASASHQADFSLMESLFADASAATDSLSVWHGDFCSFLLLFRSIRF